MYESNSDALFPFIRTSPFMKVNPTGNGTDMQHGIHVMTTFLVYQTCYWHEAVKCLSSAVFKRLRRRAALHSSHHVANFLCNLLPFLNILSGQDTTTFIAVNTAKCLLILGHVCSLGCRWCAAGGWWMSYLVSEGELHVHNHHLASYNKHRFHTHVSEKSARKSANRWVSIAYWYVNTNMITYYDGQIQTLVCYD